MSKEKIETVETIETIEQAVHGHVPPHIPRLHTPGPGLSEEKARELDLASWEMSQQGDQNV